MEYKIFGCKTNKYFTDCWAESAFLQGKKWVFISSCVVTDRAKSKWVRFAKQRLATLAADEYLFLSGCGSLKYGEIDTEFYAVYPELVQYKDRIVLLPEDPKDLGSRPHPLPQGTFSGSAIHLVPEGEGILPPSPLGRRAGDEGSRGLGWELKSRIQSAKTRGTGLHTKKFVVVQTGCDNFCTFCLTVQARGRHKSRPMDEIIAEIQGFAESRGQEIVITGTNLGAWGAESSNDFRASEFHTLVRAILDQTTIPRIRISSLGVEFVDAKILSLFREPRVMAHAHLSIQSGSDKILRSMNRHYDRATLLTVLDNLRQLKRPDWLPVNIGADLIVGFPGETESDFADTLDLVENHGVTQLHAFPFSPHKSHYSVPAGKFTDQVAENIKTRRFNRLMVAGEASKEAFSHANVGKRFRVLLERVGDGTFQGWSENYIECNEQNFTIDVGCEVRRGGVVMGVYAGK